jgi:hypothetical protein
MSDDEDENDPMHEIEKQLKDELVLAEAFSNSYRLLIEEITFDEMLDWDVDKEYIAVLTYDPDEGPTLDELEAMIEYYIESEEYERCTRIRDIMFKMFPESKLTE